jgi:proteasome alpha subunit
VKKVQIMDPEAMGYDRVVTVFSPDGRLFQVQYAMEAVKKGSTVVGVVSKDGVVLAADKRIIHPLIVPSSLEKIFKIDTHIGVATSGLVADGRKLVDEGRVEAQRNRILYNKPIEVNSLVKYVSDLAQLFTQYGGIRPFGVSLLIAGEDEGGLKLFETDPSGTPTEWKATALGEGRSEIVDFLEKNYKQSISLDDAVVLALKALKKVIKTKLNAERIELGIVKNKTFKELSVGECQKYLTLAEK